jgi:hypothetical protein
MTQLDTDIEVAGEREGTVLAFIYHHRICDTWRMGPVRPATKRVDVSLQAPLPPQVNECRPLRLSSSRGSISFR